MTPADLAQAACRGLTTREHDPWAGETAADVAEAAAVCAVCPVRAACAADAVGEEHGVWAGVLHSPLPDDVMVVAEARVRVTVQACPGSRARYVAGCRCLKCTEQNRLYKAKYDKEGPVTPRPKVVDMQVSMFEGVLA